MTATAELRRRHVVADLHEEAPVSLKPATSLNPAAPTVAPLSPGQLLSTLAVVLLDILVPLIALGGPSRQISSLWHPDPAHGLPADWPDPAAAAAAAATGETAATSAAVPPAQIAYLTRALAAAALVHCAYAIAVRPLIVIGASLPPACLPAASLRVATAAPPRRVGLAVRIADAAASTVVGAAVWWTAFVLLGAPVRRLATPVAAVFLAAGPYAQAGYGLGAPGWSGRHDAGTAWRGWTRLWGLEPAAGSLALAAPSPSPSSSTSSSPCVPWSRADPLGVWTAWSFWATMAGGWAGALALPLDWQRPWQIWPVSIVLGAVAVQALAGVMFAGAVAVRTWRGRCPSCPPSRPA
ncbi:hypothetical protein CXG81DRAFT_27705 [Caulochytrium protostelioides]|uniref:PIG-F-domain-containing protein n=1 Tax=Caulochytrium protostelioides TaxID=1555241 RepID=A0A4P9X3E8_9FUNG|nr:hypothetical protein CXG81DRAFT_27705 [Caulochytrium protostelioides]|eukprot:RKO99546.1 hypothetical protein CXG81DRAFT_27705 [Caulochytrium protostelioides]